MRKYLILSLLLVLHGAFVYAQDSLGLHYAQTITADELKAHLEVIASDEMEGRDTGTKGQKMAAEYIQQAFAEYGLTGPMEGAENPYYQVFELYRSAWDQVAFTSGKNEFKLFEDFFVSGNYQTPTRQMELVFAGYGLETDAYSDYADIDVKGKVVLILAGQPFLADGNPAFEIAPEALSSMSKVRKAQEKGAAVAMVAYDGQDAFNQRAQMMKRYYSSPRMSFKPDASASMGIFSLSPARVAAVLGVSEKKMQKAVDKAIARGVSPAGLFKQRIEITATRKVEPIGTENVLGLVEGTDLKDEMIVITAHYDHVGMSNGEIYNGADDNGSGTVSVLELAQAFGQAKAEGNGPRRSVLFIALTGEERGLLGSEYYVNNPIVPLSQKVTNLNIDMIGRLDAKYEEKNDPNYIYLIGTDMLSTDLHNISEFAGAQYVPDLKLDYRYNAKDDPNRFYYRADHYNFAKHGIPSIFYFNGVHSDYHQPTDTIDKIHFGKMEAISRLIFATAWEIAQRDERPKVDKQVSE